MATTCMCCGPSSLESSMLCRFRCNPASSTCPNVGPLLSEPALDSDATAEVLLQTICLHVRNWAGDVLTSISAEFSSSVADLKALIAREASFEYGTVVTELACGLRLLATGASLFESGLIDGDELVATRASLLFGEFGERRVGCITCGSVETVHVTFSESQPTVEVSKLNGTPQSYDYCLGEVKHGLEELEVPISLRSASLTEACAYEGYDGYTYQGVLHVSTRDATKRKLVIPDLDVEVLDVEYLEVKRQEMQRFRLSMLEHPHAFRGFLNEFQRSGASAVLSDSRRWFEEDNVEHVRAARARFEGILWRQQEEYAEVFAEDCVVPWQSFQVAYRRQAKHHCKTTYCKRWKKDRSGETRRSEVMLLKKDRQTADRARTLARKSCRRWDMLF